MIVAFCPFRKAELHILQGWFVDEELARRLSYPTENWFNYVSSPGEARSWAAFSDNEPIAMVQVDGPTGGSGYIVTAMRPDLRGRGMGSRVLMAFLRGPGQSYQRLMGYIEPDNVASLACCRRCGFVLSTNLDKDGLVQATYEPSGVMPHGSAR